MLHNLYFSVLCFVDHCLTLLVIVLSVLQCTASDYPLVSLQFVVCFDIECKCLELLVLESKGTQQPRMHVYFQTQTHCISAKHDIVLNIGPKRFEEAINREREKQKEKVEKDKHCFTKH